MDPQLEDRLLQTMKETKDLFNQARYMTMRLKVDDKLYYDAYLKVRKLQLEKGECDDKELQEMYDKSVNIRNKTDIKNIWITINPKESGTELFDLNIGIEKLKVKSYTKFIMWSYEQRGEDEDNVGKGVHLHILLHFKDETRYDSVKRSIHTIFDKLVGTPSLHVCIKPCYDRWLEDKVSYLKGEKWDEEKDDKITIDRLWREKVGLEPYYIFGTN